MKCCGECPWKVRNQNNDNFISHSKRFKKKHKCHMKTAEDIWNVTDEKHQCVGNKKYLENGIK